LEWGASKDSRVNHLLRLEPLSRLHLGIGGGPNTINAMGSSHGPSWKLVVHLDSVTEAYGIYPGGQSGNPGSAFYDNFIDDYAKGKHYKLWMMTSAEASDKKVKAHMVFSKG
jgi:penicillin G amidase